jgi:circadian clock protein KaiB
MIAKKSVRLRLYITGNSPHSVQAVSNINALCRDHLAERHEIEIVDVLNEPQRALSDGVMLTPTLVKLFPPPVCKLRGSLSDREAVLQAMGLNA